jgi:hypothetical protein
MFDHEIQYRYCNSILREIRTHKTLNYKTTEIKDKSEIFKRRYLINEKLLCGCLSNLKLLCFVNEGNLKSYLYYNVKLFLELNFLVRR